MILTAVIGLLMIIEFFFPMPASVTSLNVTLRSFVTIISATALILGTIVLTIFHTKKVGTRGSEWYYSIVYVVAFVVTAGLGVLNVRDTTFLWIYNNMTSPIGAALYSLTAFYITSAAYRVLRARNWNAAVLLVCALVVLLMLIPIGAILFPPVVPLGEWIRSFPSGAGFRGMIIGTSLGIMGLGVRVFMGRQKEHLGIREERRDSE
ncbi:hypothetical protein A3K69_05900 [Candidatus Bathyarchaeota archaeon RBG_16_57_9]|nr:MAG: hypothetical protein A3K69_05900 [Candidatus Bathyarchaeota archaeon RBG_16_57_9]OGD53961.1 MAG: hypothetical protein A3K81_00420 [Candidatus Bathyarchaeota archaeon RBG_13_60_20]